MFQGRFRGSGSGPWRTWHAEEQARSAVDHGRERHEPSRGPETHSDAASYIPVLILHMEYTKRRLNNSIRPTATCTASPRGSGSARRPFAALSLSHGPLCFIRNSLGKEEGPAGE